MWLTLAICSAVLLGVYDVAKKQASRKNGVLDILLFATGITTLFFTPFILSSIFGWHLAEGTRFEIGQGTSKDHLLLAGKAVIVTVSWITGLLGLKHLPITTASTMKATRPVFILLVSLLVFGERLNLLQWTGITVSIAALYMLSVSSRKEGIAFAHNKWVVCMFVAILSGVASAMLDKYIMTWMSPMFAQSWTNLYITIILALTILVSDILNGRREKFHWDWNILLIAVFITVSDYLYFFALSCDGSMLSVVSMLRRSSVVVTFIIGAWLFKENRLKEKAAALIILLTGIAILFVGSN